VMTSNSSFRYGFDWEREYFLDILMTYQFYMPIVTIFTFHPVVQYLLIFHNKNMSRDIRIGYIFTHLTIVLNEWSFSFLFRIYAINPIAGLYCEGPLCRAGLNKQLLMLLLATPVILMAPPFIFLNVRMHQMLLSLDGHTKLSMRFQILLGIALNSMLVANVVGFGYFGKDHNRSEQLMKEPELTWLKSRGGSIFLYGPPGDPQYFKWELGFLAISILIISPPLIFFTADAMKNIRMSSANNTLLQQIIIFTV
ncbi:hypothetical protein PFISCL1PPCAC_20747, partial [Pristionchus fissidentatus]